MPSVVYGTRSIEFEVLRKPRMKHTYIEVTANGVVIKTNSSTSMKSIYALVSKKSAWIAKHLESLKEKKVKKELTTGSKIYYLGKENSILIKEEKKLKRAELEFIDSKFVFRVEAGVSQDELDWLLNMFYKQRAVETIEPMVEKWSKKMNLIPTSVGFRKAKTRWGSCSSRNRISFNYYLLKLPSSLIEYVVVHELAHIQHKNHSADFWKLVYEYIPDYKNRKERIREFEKLI